MRRLPVAMAFCLLYALPVAGQERRLVTIADLPRMVYRGLETISGRPHRFTKKANGQTLRFEVDPKRSIRTTVLRTNSDAIDSECIVIGDQIYERSGNDPWSVQSRAEYTRAQADRAAAMKDALSKNDTDTYKRLSAAPYNKATSAAIHRYTMDFVAEPTNSNIFDKAVAFVGTNSYNNNVLSFYRFRGSTNNFTPPSKELRTLRIDIMYGFDKKTGDLLMVRTRHDWVYESKTITHMNLYEWEYDPSIVITKPVVVAVEHKT